MSQKRNVRKNIYYDSIEGKLDLASRSVKNGDFENALEYYDSILDMGSRQS